MTVNAISPGIWSSLQSLFGLIEETDGKRDLSPSSNEIQADREFIQDMINRSPEAFASDLDVLNMMHMYPGRIYPGRC